eukprot:2282358-Prymnesium_polylepis.1
MEVGQRSPFDAASRGWRIPVGLQAFTHVCSLSERYHSAVREAVGAGVRGKRVGCIGAGVRGKNEQGARVLEN